VFPKTAPRSDFLLPVSIGWRLLLIDASILFFVESRPESGKVAVSPGAGRAVSRWPRNFLQP